MPLTLERRRKEDKEDKKKEKERKKEEKKEKKKYKTKNEEYMDKKIDELSRQLQEEKQNTRREKLAVARLQRELSKVKTETPSRETLMKDLVKERELRLEAEKRLTEMTTESETCKTRLETLQTEFETMEDAVKNMLQYKSKIEQLKMEKSNVILAYENNLQKFRTHINNLEQDNSSLMNEFQNRQSLVNQEESRKEKSLLLERLRALEAENSALVLENESQREQYERCLDEVANQVVQALLMQKDLRAECIKLQNRVFDLEQQNKILNMMFERERQRHSTRELSMQTYPSKHSRGRGLTSDAPKQTTNEDSSISEVSPPTTSNSASQALYRPQGATGSAQSSPSNQKRNNKPANKSGGSRQPIRKESGNSTDYAGLSSESLHSTHSNQANHAYPAVPTMQLGWSPTSKHKAFANGDSFQGQSDFSLQRHAHSLDRFGNGCHGSHMKETSAMIDMFAHYGRPDRLYPQFSGAQQELAEERMYQASAQNNLYQGSNGKMQNYDEIAMNSEMPAKLKETFRAFHEESLQAEHMICLQPTSHHLYAKTEKPSNFPSNRRDFNSPKPALDHMASRNGLIVADKYHLPYKHAPYETAQSVMKELNDATANVKSFDSLVASDAKHSKKTSDRQTSKTTARSELSSLHGSLESLGTDDSEGAAETKGLLDSSFSLNSLESSDDDDDGGGQEMYQMPSLSGERNEIMRTTGEMNYDRSPSQARKIGPNENNKSTEKKEINTPISSSGKIVNDLDGVKDESTAVDETDGVNNNDNSNLNKLSTYTSPWRKDPRAALNISLDVPMNDYGGQSAFVQYTSVTRNHISYKPESAMVNDAALHKEKAEQRCADDVNGSENVKVAVKKSSSEQQVLMNSVLESVAMKSQSDAQTKPQVVDISVKQKLSSPTECITDLPDSVLGKALSKCVIDGEREKPVKKKVFQKQSPVEEFIPPQPVRLLEEEDDDSLYHRKINKELVELMKQRTSEDRSSEGKGQTTTQPNCKSTITSGNYVHDVDGIQPTDQVQSVHTHQVPVQLTNGSLALWLPSTKPELIKQSSLNETYRDGREDGLCEEERRQLYRRLSAENRVPSFISPERLNLAKQESTLADIKSNSPLVNPDERPIRPYYASKEARKEGEGMPGREQNSQGKALEVAKCSSSNCKVNSSVVDSSCGKTGKTDEEQVKLKDLKCFQDGHRAELPSGARQTLETKPVSDADKVKNPSVVGGPSVKVTNKPTPPPVPKKPGRTQSDSSLLNKTSKMSTFQIPPMETQDLETAESTFVLGCASVREVEVLNAQTKDFTLLNLSPRLVFKSAPLKRSPCQILSNGILEDESEMAAEESKHFKPLAFTLSAAEKSKKSGSIDSLNSLTSVDSVGSAAASLHSSISKKSATPLSEFLSDSEEEEDKPIVNFIDVLTSWTPSSKLTDAEPIKSGEETMQNEMKHTELEPKPDKNDECKTDNHGNKRPIDDRGACELSNQRLPLRRPVPKPESSSELRNGHSETEHVNGITPADAVCADKNGKVLFDQEDSSADPSEMKDLGTEKFCQKDPKVVKENFNATSAKIEEIRKTSAPNGERTTVDDCAVLTRPTTLFIPTTKATTLRPFDYKMMLRVESDRKQNNVQLYKRPVYSCNVTAKYHPPTNSAAAIMQHRTVATETSHGGGKMLQTSASHNGVKLQPTSTTLEDKCGTRLPRPLRKNEPRPVFLRSVYHENQSTKPQLGAVSTSHFAMKNDDVPFIDDSSSGQESDSLKTPEDFARMEKEQRRANLCEEGQFKGVSTAQLGSHSSVGKQKINGFAAEFVGKGSTKAVGQVSRTDKPVQGVRSLENTQGAQRVEIFLNRPDRRTDSQGVRHSDRTTDVTSGGYTHQTNTTYDAHPQRSVNTTSSKHCQTSADTTGDRHPQLLNYSQDRYPPTRTSHQEPNKMQNICTLPAVPNTGSCERSSHQDERQTCHRPSQPTQIDIRVESKAAPIISADLMEDFEGSDLYDSDDLESAGEGSAQLDEHERANLLDSFFESDSDDSAGDSDDSDSSHPGEDTFLRLIGEKGNRRQVLRYSETNRVSILDFKIQELYTRYDDKEREAMACFDFLEELVEEIDTEANDNPFMDTNQNSQTDIASEGAKVDSDSDDEGMQRERHSEGSSSPERLSLSDSLYDSYSSSSHSLSSNH